MPFDGLVTESKDTALLLLLQITTSPAKVVSYFTLFWFTSSSRARSDTFLPTEITLSFYGTVAIFTVEFVITSVWSLLRSLGKLIWSSIMVTLWLLGSSSWFYSWRHYSFCFFMVDSNSYCLSWLVSDLSVYVFSSVNIFYCCLNFLLIPSI